VEPSFGWVSLAPKALARARDQMREEGQGVRDEVGFLLLHQRYADRFFPGTSVLHTRLRYALFVPWLFEDQAGRPAAEAQNALRTAETALAKRLRDAHERGVIGGLVWPDPADQPPSTVYWSALDAWGILRRDVRDRVPTRRAVHARLAARHGALDDDAEPLHGYEPPFVRLPDRPVDWPASSPLTFRLTDAEREFLRERLATVMAPPGRHLSLFSRLVRDGLDPPPSMWSSNVVGLADRDAAPLRRARALASLAAIGRGVYAALVETQREADGRETPRTHRDHLLVLLTEHRSAATALKIPDLAAVEDDIGDLPPRLRRLLVETLDWLAGGSVNPADLFELYAAAEARKGSRARLGATGHARARRAEWNPAEHPPGYPLHYRWPWVADLLSDLRSGRT
jgi:hypothetical protein